MTERVRIGISGDACGGKDSTGMVLEREHGCVHVSCSDLLREHIAQSGLGVPDRTTMTRVAHELRATKGASYLVDMGLDQYGDVESLALSGIYSPAEARRVKQAGGSIIMVVCRDPHIRYVRYLERQKILARPENLSYEEFLEAFARENTGDSGQQDVAGVSAIADFHIHNEGSLAELTAQVANTYQEIVGNNNGNHRATA